MSPPQLIDTPAHRRVWAYLQHAAASGRNHLPQFDGVILHVVLPFRIEEEHTIPLLDDLVEQRLIRCWSSFHPGEHALPDGNPEGQHRCCILVSRTRFAALVPEQGGSTGPDAPPEPA